MPIGKFNYNPTAKSIPFNGIGTELAPYKNMEDAIRNAGTFGGGFNYGASEAESNTGSTTYVEKFSLVLTGMTAGTYLLSWSTGVKTDNGSSKAMGMRVQLDNTTDVAEIHIQNTAGEWDTRSGFIRVNLTGGTHQLDMDFLSKSGTANLRRSRLSIWRVTT